MQVQLNQDDIIGIIDDGAADAISAAKSEAELILDQLNSGLQENEVQKVQYQVDLVIKVSIDVPNRKVKIKGGYGAKTANLKKFGNGVEREIAYPDQTDMFDGTTPKPEDETE